MNGLPYYKAYPRDFLEGTIGMPFEVKAAYRLLLDLIYMQDGRLTDDARYISGHLGVTVRKWNIIRSELIERGKIQIISGFIANYRADKELETSRKFQENQAEKAAKPKKNNGLPKAAAKPARDNTEPDTDIATANAAAIGRDAHRETSDLDDLEVQCREAAGLTDSPSPGLLVIGPIVEAIANGADLELDVLPVMRLFKARRRFGQSWTYYLKAIADAKATRLSQPVGVPARSQAPPQRQRTSRDDMNDVLTRFLSDDRPIGSFGRTETTGDDGFLLPAPERH